MPRKKEELKLEINPTFEPLFMDSLDAPRYYQVFGGRGSGKSFAVAIASVQLTYSEYKHKILYLRQTMTTAEDSTIADIRLAILTLGLQNDFREKSGLITNIRTGSTISFKGIRSSGNQTAKLKSLSGITTLVIEEAEEVESFEEFSKIDESIRVKGKPLKVVLIYNPTSALKSWIHKEWFLNGIPKNDRVDTMYMHSTYKDNIKNLNQSVVKRYQDLELVNPLYYRNVILAEWTLDVQGRIYAGWAEYDNFEERGDIWYGMDFGYGGNDKTSCIEVNYFEGRYYVREMFSESKLSIRRTISSLRDSGVPFNAKIFADSAVPLLIGEIRSGGFINIRKATKGDKKASIKNMQNKEIVLVGGDKSKNLHYAYMTFGHDAKGNLPHEPDELAALRYGISSKKPLSNPKKNPVRRVRRVGGFL